VISRTLFFTWYEQLRRSIRQGRSTTLVSPSMEIPARSGWRVTEGSWMLPGGRRTVVESYLSLFHHLKAGGRVIRVEKPDPGRRISGGGRENRTAGDPAVV